MSIACFTIKVVLMDLIGSKCVWKSRCDWSTHSAASWKSYSIFTCELVWKISGLNLVWNFSYMKIFIHEIGVNFLSGMFNLVQHVKFLICIHFKHVSGVNQVWNRPDLMRIFCTGVLSRSSVVIKWLAEFTLKSIGKTNPVPVWDDLVHHAMSLSIWDALTYQM